MGCAGSVREEMPLVQQPPAAFTRSDVAARRKRPAGAASKPAPATKASKAGAGHGRGTEPRAQDMSGTASQVDLLSLCIMQCSTTCCCESHTTCVHQHVCLCSYKPQWLGVFAWSSPFTKCIPCQGAVLVSVEHMRNHTLVPLVRCKLLHLYCSSSWPHWSTESALSSILLSP